MNKKKSSDAVGKKILSDVAKEGWCCVDVPGDGVHPPYSYTVGLDRTFGHPELSVFGLKPEITHPILADAVRRVRNEGSFLDGQSVQDLLVGYDCRIVEVPESAVVEHFGYGTWFYGSPSVRALQIAWPDRYGRFPWERGVEPRISAIQPVFGKEPLWTDFGSAGRDAGRKLVTALKGGLRTAVATGKYETVRTCIDGSRTVRFRIDFEGSLDVTATLFDDPDGRVRIESLDEPAE